MESEKIMPKLIDTPEGLTLVAGDLSLRGDFAAMKDRLAKMPMSMAQAPFGLVFL